MDLAVGLELTKLLLQVVLAGDVVTAPERTALDHAARRPAGRPGLDLVCGVLDREQRLPPPNMALLGAHRAVVFREAAQVAAADGVHADELALIKTIVELLR
ncbi:MAG: hypothetical protein FJ137_06450 [Deltaproteobacteria bacterium]|nr:hypothetical protein [Deltaproteobacteria bacterium]